MVLHQQVPITPTLPLANLAFTVDVEDLVAAVAAGVIGMIVAEEEVPLPTETRSGREADRLARAGKKTRGTTASATDGMIAGLIAETTTVHSTEMTARWIDTNETPAREMQTSAGRASLPKDDMDRRQIRPRTIALAMPPSPLAIPTIRRPT
ncbi:hypothetical protein BC567DRAFT_224691 [Phyllosticta citribraziliensis]